MERNGLTIIFPTRYTPELRSALNAYARQSCFTEGEIVRMAVAKFLEQKRSYSPRKTHGGRKDGNQ